MARLELPSHRTDNRAVKIRQYVYFGISSDVLRPGEIAERVGLAADSEWLRGSRIEAPPHPIHHVWKVECGDKGLGVGEQVARVMERVWPRRAAIRELVEGGEVKAWLQIVRYFGDEEGKEEEIDATPEGLVKLTGQHQLLGWHLDRQALAFLTEVDAELDADEYG